MKKTFITFGGGRHNYLEAADRLSLQAASLQIFDDIKSFKDSDLKSDPEFWERHGEFVENNHRGYGYWLWKSYLIKKTMSQMNNGDIILYLDSGCELDIRKKSNFDKFFEIVKKDYIVGTKIFNECEWNKMDLLLLLDVLDDKYLNTPQHQAGAILLYICDKTRAFVNEWYELACNYHNIDDSPSVQPNFDCFSEHRHDQSIFSLLSKKYNMYSNENLEECIEYARNRGGVSIL
jgi:hypothetical protein